MLTVSLHGIRIHAPNGLYPQEQILGNDFEVDADIMLHADGAGTWPFVDYTLIRNIVAGVFRQPDQLLEALTRDIYGALRLEVPEAQKIRVAVRKQHPPMAGDVGYAQVCFED